MQILKDLYQVGGDLNGITFDQNGALWNDGNSYVLDTKKGLIMFDCGCGDTLDQIFSNMNYWDLNPKNITHCILTHPHFDHAGAGHKLTNLGIKIIAIKETADAVAAGDERCCGYLYHKTFTPFKLNKELEDGEIFDVHGISIETMHLPGHSMGCTAYFFTWEGRKIVVSGDVIGTLLGGDFGWGGSIDFCKEKYLASLLRFSKRDTDIMLPGHGLIYFHKPRIRVEEALNAALMQWR